MTDSEKLDLLLDKVVSMENRMSTMEDSMSMMGNRMSTMEDSIQVLQNGQQKMQDDILSLKQNQETISRDMKDVKQRISSMEMTLENEIRNNIKIVAENHSDLLRKLDDALKIENEKELLLIRVNILENEVRKLKERLEVTA